MTDPPPPKSIKRRGFRGPLAWMAKNSVAANILMFVLIIGGLLNMGRVKQEVFPEVDLDLILVSIPYPGASPEEVENGVVLAVEEAIRGIDGVKEIRGTAEEGVAVVSVKLLLGTDADQALNDVKAAVDRIVSFPEDVERPNVFMASNRYEVLSMAVYGDKPEQALRDVAEQVRDELLQDKRITYVELLGIRPLEVSIEVPQNELIEHGLTLDQIANVVRASSVDVPGGGVKTASGEVLLRTDERRDRGFEYEGVTLLTGEDGAELTVGDIAEVKDGFAESDVAAYFEGKRAVMVKVYRTGNQTPLEVSAAVYEFFEKRASSMPPGVELGMWFDMSEFYKGRIDLLKTNALIGLVLVFLVLGLFLELKLAFWVTLGIPISFLGAFLFLPAADVSINMISLFAFILVLGMVVDDAIVVGESVYKYRQDGMGRMRAAVEGAKEVAVPVTFAVITTVVAYLPMMFVPGVFGKFFRVIPIVVITVLLLSLVESLFVLPAHLAHSTDTHGKSVFGWIAAVQQRFSRLLERLIEITYVPTLRWATRYRYVTLAIGFGIFFISLGYAGGRMNFSPMPQVDSDVVIAMASMPHGTSIQRTQELEERMLQAARDILDESGGEARIKRGLFSLVGAQGFGMRDPGRGPGLNEGSHLTEVAVYMKEDRPIRASEFAQKWRKKLQNVPGLEKISFNFATGPGAGPAINLEISHRNRAVLEEAAQALAEKISEFDGVHDLDDGFAEGKQQLNLKLTPEGRSLGLTEFELARQVRSAFFGAEAVRQQRGRDEVRTYVRLPKSERESEYNVEELLIRTPAGGWVPFSQAATVERGRAYTSIVRIDGRRSLNVQAAVDETRGNARNILASLQEEALPELVARYPGLTWAVAGPEKDFQEANKTLFVGFAFAMVMIFALLAVVFRSYTQPLIVMMAIPFGFVGAIWGHVVMGYNMSLMSVMGVVALAGVVVNDSLLLVVTINRYREDGIPLVQAVNEAGARRFRPILLTSLTTFFGLVPMILETSVQARFMIPMALSLGFGVMFATFVTLVLVPGAYMALDDVKRVGSKAWRFVFGEPPTVDPVEDEKQEAEQGQPEAPAPN